MGDLSMFLMMFNDQLNRVNKAKHRRGTPGWVS